MNVYVASRPPVSTRRRIVISVGDCTIVVDRVRGGGGGAGRLSLEATGSGGGAGAVAGASTGIHVPEKSGLLCPPPMPAARTADKKQAPLSMSAPFRELSLDVALPLELISSVFVAG